MDLQRKQEAGTRQRLGLIAQITLIEIERGFAIELEQDVAL